MQKYNVLYSCKNNRVFQTGGVLHRYCYNVWVSGVLMSFSKWHLDLIKSHLFQKQCFFKSRKDIAFTALNFFTAWIIICKTRFKSSVDRVTDERWLLKMRRPESILTTLNLDKYDLQSGQIQFTFRTNTFAISTNIFCNS